MIVSTFAKLTLHVLCLFFLNLELLDSKSPLQIYNLALITHLISSTKTISPVFPISTRSLMHHLP